MIHLDLSNDAPFVETLVDEGTRLIRLTTAMVDGDEDKVTYLQDPPVEVWFSASIAVNVRNLATKAAIGRQVRIRERDLPGFGSYEIRSHTRRGTALTFFIDIIASEDDSKIRLSIDPRSTKCRWVVGDEVVDGSSTDKVSVEVALEG